MIIETRFGLQMMLVGVACAVAGGISLMTALKWIEQRRVSSWRPVQGRIISSGVEHREVRTDSDSNKTETRNFPAITFEYEAAGQKRRGTRYSIMDQVGNNLVKETLARYPRGQIVTVYYNPDKPGEAVIERTMPEGSLQFMAKLSIGLIVATLALVFGISGLFDVVHAQLPHPRSAGVAVFLILAGLVLTRFACAMRAEAMAAKAWPRIKGRIEQSVIEGFRTVDKEHPLQRRPGLNFRSRITYAYTIAGQHYVGERVAFGMVLSSNLIDLISSRAIRYLPGSAVDVFCDPADPANAVLERRVSGLWLLWALVAVCFGAAAAALAGVF